MLRAGVVVTLATGALVGVAAPAQAMSPTVAITGFAPGTLRPGDTATLKFKVTNGPNGPADEQVDIKVNVPGELSCTGSCDMTVALDPDEASPEYTASIRVKTPPAAGQSKQVTLEITAVTANEGDDNGKATRNVTLIGPEVQQPTTVKDVTVRVFDVGTGQPIPSASIVIEDSNNTQWTATASSTGQHKITSTAGKPIAIGQISVAAGMDGYANAVKSVEARAGQSVVIEIRLQSTASAAPTADPSALISPELTPDGALSPGEQTADVVDTGNASDGGGFPSWVLIVMGGLLVALGVGAIVLLLLRRRDDGEEGEIMEGPEYVGPRGPTPLPAGRYGDGTRALGDRPGDRTMLTRSPLADAPTMMHQVQPAEYGVQAPRPPQPGYGPPAVPPQYGAGQPTYPTSPSPAAYGSPAYPSSPPGYGPEPAGYGPRGGATDPYGRAGEYAAPPAEYDDRGYSAGGYGAPGPRRYDDGYGQPASGYDPPADGYGPTSYEPRYDAGGGGYAPAGYEQQQGGGYAQPRSYGQPGYEPGEGYGGANGYDSRASGYEGRGANGYEQRSGYDNGYDRVPDQRSGYESQGYDQEGYYEEPASRRSAPSARSDQRRPLDWLDD